MNCADHDLELMNARNKEKKMQHYRGSAVLKPKGRQHESAVSVIQGLTERYAKTR